MWSCAFGFPMPLPYKYIEWVPGDRVVMERFDDYTPRSEPQNGGGGAKISYFDRIEMVVIPDACHSPHVEQPETFVKRFLEFAAQ